MYGIYIYTYIYRKNQPFMLGKYTFGMGMCFPSSTPVIGETQTE